MTRAQEIRDECLFQLYGGRPLPHKLEKLRKTAHRQGFGYTETEIRAELDFLCGQGLAETVRDEATGEHLWKITSKGVLNYEEQERDTG